MALSSDDQRRLDDGADHAKADFERNWRTWHTARDVAEWWSKWCRREVISHGRIFNGTNHDRLGRILVEVTGVANDRSPGPELDIKL